MKFTTAIFDMDGVVIDSERLWEKADGQLFALHRIPYSRATVGPFLAGMHFNEGTALLKKTYQFKGSLRKLIEQRRSLVKNEYLLHLRYMDGFKSFHTKLKRLGVQTCIATSSIGDFLNIAKRKLQLSDLFTGNIFSIADVGHKSKPDPAIFLFAAKQMNSDPAECFVIEDSPKGIEAAKNANMKCIAITHTFPNADFGKADFVVSKFSEIDLEKL